jgi:hypothetical protein
MNRDDSRIKLRDPSTLKSRCDDAPVNIALYPTLTLNRPDQRVLIWPTEKASVRGA